jgi:hypothetical protein
MALPVLSPLPPNKEFLIAALDPVPLATQI